MRIAVQELPILALGSWGKLRVHNLWVGLKSSSHALQALKFVRLRTCGDALLNRKVLRLR